MIQIETQGLVSPDQPVPIAINQLLDYLRNQQSPYSIKLVSGLEQLQQAIALIWQALQSPDEILLADLLITDPSGALAMTIGQSGIVGQETNNGTKSFSITPATLALIEAASGNEATIAMSVGTGTALVTITRLGSTVCTMQFDGAGSIIGLVTGGQVDIGGNRIITDRQAAVTTVTATTPQTAGATYTGTEQSMLGSLKAEVDQCKQACNDIIARMQSHGLIS